LEKKESQRERSFDFSGKNKQIRFVESGDIDIKKLVQTAIPESAKQKKSTKYERSNIS